MVINESYPPDCMRYQHLVDPAQHQYIVPGSEPIEEAEAAERKAAKKPTHIEFENSSSLQLKPDKHASIGTTSRSEGSTELASTLAVQAMSDRHTAKEATQHSDQPLNDLERAIEEAKRLDDLVCPFSRSCWYFLNCTYANVSNSPGTIQTARAK